MPEPNEPANGQQSGETPPASSTPPGASYEPPPGTPQDFAEWLKSRPEEDREQYDAHTRSLQTGLERERNTNKTLRQEVKNIAAQAEGATKAELDALGEKLAVADQRIDFYRQAVREGVPNVDLAWLAAREIGAFDKHGAPDFSVLKAQYPELFPKRHAAAQAGAGANGGTPQAVDMNAFIRRSAGRS